MIANCAGADVIPRSECNQAGTVSARFSHSALVCLDDYRLVTLLQGMRQRGMRVINIMPSSWHSVWCQLDAGQKVVLKADVLEIGEIRVPLGNVPRWQSPPLASCLCSSHLNRERLATASAWLKSFTDERGCGESLAWRAAHDCFLITLRALDGPAETLDSAVRSTVGLGPGLTPSGDDMLAGLLIGLEAAGLRANRDRLASSIGRNIDVMPLSSRDMLEQASRGWVTDGIANVLAALSTQPGAADLIDALSAQSAIGHHSGTDVLLGIFAGLESIELLAPTPVTSSLESN